MQSFQYIKPSPALAPYIRYYWILQDDADSPVSERTMPIGCIQMIFRRLYSFDNYNLKRMSAVLHKIDEAAQVNIMLQQADVPFAQVAYECAFFDQSHMIKEFRLFSGYTPAEFLSVCAPYSDYFSEG